MFPICGWTPIPFTTTTEAPATTTTPVPVYPDPECDQNSNGTLHNNLIKNGHITCDNPKKCYARCDVGYIPENSANKQKIFSHVTCENNQWSDLAFNKCIKFESFCNFTQELSDVFEDPNAKLVLRVWENPPSRPAVVGRIRAEMKCRRDNFYFNKINKSYYRLRCECLYRNGRYICKKWPGDIDLDVGICEDVDTLPFSNTRKAPFLTQVLK